MVKLRHLDLFSGIGGFSLGLERTGGFQTVAFCDSDKKTHLVLKKHWPNVPIFDDVSTLKGKDLGTVEIITGGFPCQDLSVAGKGAGLAGARSGLWWQFHRLIEETQPKYVIAENVAVLRSRGLDEVLRSLAEIGYDAEWHCIPASAVGAPHRRDRIWIVAYPSGGQRISRPEEQRVLRALSEDGTINNHSSGRSETHSSPLAHTDSSVETNGGKCSIPTQQSDGGRIGQTGGGTDDRERCFRSSGKGSENCIVRAINKSDFWEVEPQLGRVADGIPNRMDRLKQLGNSLVPQIPELIGYAILKNEGIKT